MSRPTFAGTAGRLPGSRAGITLSDVEDSERVERRWPGRLRWRMRGAWLWPVFLVLTPLEAVLVSALPPYEGAPVGFMGGLLLAGFANLLIVAVIGPLAGRAWRRRRKDRPYVVAADQAGTVLLCLLAVVMLAAGLAHRPAAAAEERDLGAAYGAAHQYVITQRPEYRPGLQDVDALRLAEDAYRVCVPGERWLCLYVDTDQDPAGVRRDPSTEPNSALRTVGGFH